LLVVSWVSAPQWTSRGSRRSAAGGGGGVTSGGGLGVWAVGVGQPAGETDGTTHGADYT